MISLRHQLSIRDQLLLLALAVSLPAAAIFVYYAADDSRQAREAAYANLRLAADNTAARLDRILQEHEQVLERLAARPMVKALDPRHCDPIIVEYVRLHPEFTTLAVRNAQAGLACSFNPKPPPPSRIVGLDWFRQGMRSGKFSVGNVYRGQSSGRWVSVLTYPIRNARNEVSGLIAFALDLRTLDRRVFQRAPKDVVQLVLDRNAKVLLRSVDSANWIGRALPELQAEVLGAKHTGIFSMRGVDGVRRLYALATVPDAGWHVLAGLPEEQAFADYHARVRRAAFAGFGTLLLVFGLAWRLARAIARPVSELAATATRIAAGDAGARARIAGPAEIRYVAREFNCMLDAQERQREERAALIGEFERLVRLARDIFLLLDPAGNIVEANAAAAAAYGYGADELRRMNVRELRAPQARSTLAQDWEKSLQPGGVLLESVHQRKDGTTFPVEISSQTIDIGGKPYRQSFIRDISARHAAAEQIKRLNTAYAMLSETNQSIVRLGDEAELLQHICRVAVDFGGYAGAWVALIDAPSRRLVPAAIEGRIGEYVHRITISTDPERPEGRGPMALALREGRPYYCRDFFDDPATEPWQALAAKAGIRALAALPLRRGGKVIGTFNLYSAEPAVYDDATRALLEEMALDISFAMDNFEREAARRKAEIELKHSEAHYRSLFENMQEGLAYCEMLFAGDTPQDFVYLDVNEAFERLTSLKAVVGRRVTEVIPGIKESNPELFAIYGRVAATGRAERFETYLPGLDIWFSVSAFSPERGRFVAVFDNITKRKRADEALRESEERLRNMLEQNIAAVFMLEDGALSYANRRSGELLGYASEELLGRPVLDFVAPADRPMVAEALRQLLAGERQTVERNFVAVRKDGSFADIGAHAVLATLRGKRAILGMAADIGERKKAQAEIDRYVARLEQAMQSTLQAVSLMVELRDPYTAGHERRVGELAAAIGIEMGLSEATVKGLRLAGYVHDIGKVSIPAEILSKPSRLTAMEFELIKGHCRSGYDVLKGVDFPWPVADVILQHHERLDGSGYPRALKDGEILLEARIIAVADVVEAMSSHRPYRAGLGSEAALAEIETKAGILYDSAVAAACLRLFRERAYRLDT